MDDAERVLPQNVESSFEDRRANDRQRRWLVLCVLLGTGAVVFALYHIAGLVRKNFLDQRFTPVARVDLTEPKVGLHGRLVPAIVTGPTLRVAIAPVVSPEMSLQMYKELVDYLAEKLDREPIFLQGSNYEQVNDLLRNGQCDLALVCSLPFVRGNEEFGLEALAVPVIDGVDYYHSYIIVPQSSRATSLLDLRGKRFGSADKLSNSGYLYPMVWLEEHGEDSRTFFHGNHVITGSHDRSVRQVVSQRVDGAAVDSLVYDRMKEEDPTIGQTTRIIDISPEFGMPPVVVPRGIAPDLKSELLSLLLQMHRDPQGWKVLAALQIDNFVRPRVGLFDCVRENAKYLESRR